MTEPWRILIVEDEEQLGPLVAESVLSAARSDEGGDPIPSIESKFSDAMTRIAAERFDLLILDVRDQAKAALGQQGAESDPGIGVFEEIRRRRFIPIIFYTAVPDEVELLGNPPFVQVVSKIAEDPVRELREAVTLAFRSDFPRIYRLLEDHSAAVTRDFMVEFVENNWDTLADNRADMMHLLLRHLSVSLGHGAAEMTARLGYGTRDGSEDTVHASRYYSALPSEEYTTGDVLRGPRFLPTNDDGSEPVCWYVIVTPSCDFVEGRKKAEFVVLLECRPLESFDEYSRLVKAGSEDSSLGRSSDRLKSLLGSRPHGRPQDRYHYLPAAWTVPHLMVDNQQVVSVPYNELVEAYKKVASLDSRFAEELVHRFTRYVGRLGTPDLDLDAIVTRMVQDARG
ncbi:MAG: hypothetical protein OXG47_07765 [bacterium]|nr:hypothetical protein [bacterium]